MTELRKQILKHIVGRQVSAAQMAFILGKTSREVAKEMADLHRERLIEGTWDSLGYWIYEAVTDPTV